MMRHIIMWECEDEQLGRTILPKSLVFPEKLPIVWNFEMLDVDSIIGEATEIRRVRDGYISAEITLRDRSYTTKHEDGPAGDVYHPDGRYQTIMELLNQGDLCFTIYAVKVKEDDHGRIVSGEVRCVSLMLAYSGANPPQLKTVPWVGIKAEDVE